MYTIKAKKVLVLLLIINIILLTGLVSADSVTAEDSKKIYNPVIEKYGTDIVSNNQLLGYHEDEKVEYQINDTETIIVTVAQAKKLDKMKQDYIEKQRKIAKVTVKTSKNTKFSSINVHSDLSVMNTVNTDQLNKIIDYWDSKSSGVSAFKGKGQAFIDASKATGLDPVYILAHAGLESGWGNSQIAREKHNYFGINAVDSSPYTSSKHMASNTYDGIIKGAKWIKDNYYENGQTTLYTMRYNNGHHEYCTSKQWMYDIADIMQTSYKLIQ